MIVFVYMSFLCFGWTMGDLPGTLKGPTMTFRAFRGPSMTFRDLQWFSGTFRYPQRPSGSLKLYPKDLLKKPIFANPKCSKSENSESDPALFANCIKATTTLEINSGFWKVKCFAFKNRLSRLDFFIIFHFLKRNQESGYKKMTFPLFYMEKIRGRPFWLIILRLLFAICAKWHWRQTHSVEF